MILIFPFTFNALKLGKSKSKVLVKVFEVSSHDEINMTELWLDYDRKIFTMTNVYIPTRPKILTMTNIIY